MYKKIFFTLLVLLFHNIAFSQTQTREGKGIDTKKEIQNKCKTIVEDFMNDKMKETFEGIGKMWVFPEDELDYMERKSMEQLNSIESKFGKPLENKLVKEELIEGVLYRLSYAIRYERHGLRIRFTFYYGAENKWYLDNFKWDDSLDELFED